MSSLDSKIKQLPQTPGVYLFKDKKDKILYIGKAGNLRKRVAQYFTAKAHSPKIEVMLKQIAGVDHVATPTEVDALLFEAALVNQHSPRYNTRLKDDKSYPLVKITNEKYPQLVLTRRKDKGGTYFGPFTDASLLREAVQLIHATFPIRKCKTLPKKACLYYYINQCTAPCIKTDATAKKEYDSLIDEVASFLGAGKKSFITHHTKKMKEEASQLHFEEAGLIKKRIEALTNLRKKRFSLKRGAAIFYTATRELKTVLGIKGRLDRIVCFDVSDLMGKWAVASKVSFYRELPDKSDYRRFKIKTVKGIHDYDMMREALRRMLGDMGPKQKNAKPDLIMIDGGKGHLSVSAQVLKEEGFSKIPIVAIAKRFETLYMSDKEPILLPDDSATLHFADNFSFIFPAKAIPILPASAIS